jgi:LPS-assembly lipoprotein
MRLSLFYIIAAGFFLSACGWQLRGLQSDQKPLPQIVVVSNDNYSPMTLSVREALQKQSADENTDVVYRLRILEEDIEKRPVTYNATGTPAQYEMTLKVTYAIESPSSTTAPLPRTATTHRIFDFDPRNVVAKSEEERSLLQHMRQQLAQRLISEISRQHNARSDNPAHVHE